MSSIFTKIINGEIPAHKVYEDDLVLAFLDIQPSSKGHTLVVPKQEIDHFDNLPDELYQHLMLVSKRIAKQIKTVYSPLRVGMMVFGTEVPHAHVHLIPLYTGSEMAFVRNADGEPDHEKLAQVAEELKISCFNLF